MWNELRSGLAAALTSAGFDAGPALERLELAIPRERDFPLRHPGEPQ